MLKKRCSLCLMLVCLILVLTGCSAEQLLLQNSQKTNWTFVASNDSRSTYIDTDTIERNGDIVGVLVLLDYTEEQDFVPEADSFMSMARYKEIDCREGKFRNLEQILYSDNMGFGHQLSSTAELLPSNWLYIPPRTFINLIQDNVCNLEP